MRIFRRVQRRPTITQIRKSGRIGESHYVVFDDGAIVIETPRGVHRFNDPQELLTQANSVTAAVVRPLLRLV